MKSRRPGPAPRRRSCLGGLALAGALAVAAGTGEAALPPPPLSLSVAPWPVREGRRATFRIDRTGVAAIAAEEAVDVYLLLVLGDGVLFLDPSGTWRLRPTPLRTGARLAALDPILVDWPEARVPGPARTLTLAVVVVTSGADPLRRVHWRSQPALAAVPVRVSLGESPRRGLLALVATGVGALAAAALVVAFPDGLSLLRRRAGPPGAAGALPDD